MAVFGTIERNTRMHEITVEIDEIELTAALLKENAAQLETYFVQSVQKYPHTLSVSVLTPITEASMTAFYESLGDYCHQCGTAGVFVLKCSRCRKATYCSKECQKKNWKWHKQSSCQPARADFVRQNVEGANVISFIKQSILDGISS